MATSSMYPFSAGTPARSFVPPPPMVNMVAKEFRLGVGVSEPMSRPS